MNGQSGGVAILFSPTVYTPVRKSESMPATSDFDHNNSSYNLLGDLKLNMLMYAPMLLINSKFHKGLLSIWQFIAFKVRQVVSQCFADFPQASILST